MLNIEHLTKTYGGKAAVQDLSLHIRPGEICAFIGHNGAGKTTTLKCCCGIQQFDSGRITVDGISVQADCTVEEMKLADTDMVVLPGGLGGVQSILASETSMNFIRLAYEKNCYVAAICAAPTILARLHITDGRKATCYPGMEDQMGTAQMIPCGAVQDGSVITGRAAGSADEFGLACLRALKGEETARQVASGIVYRA